MSKEKNYKATIVESNKSLTAKEKIMLKDTSDALSLGELVEVESLLIKPELWATVHIENDLADNKEYDVYIVVDKDGQKYKTSSESFYRSFSDICDEITDAIADGEDIGEFEIKVYNKESRNYKGKSFITCSIV